MPKAPLPPDEAMRLAALKSLGILDTAASAELDALVRVAALVCGVPISLISLIDEERQWFKANEGLPEATETHRDSAFCAYTILGDDVMEVSDATLDPRFSDNPLVTGDPNIRFYAGVPLRLHDGSKIGSLCVIDREARQLGDTQREVLRNLAQAVVGALDNWSEQHVQSKAALDVQVSEGTLRRLRDGNSAMLQAVDGDGRMVAVSDAWLGRFGYTRREVIGRPYLDFLTPQSAAALRAMALPKFLAAGSGDNIESQMVAKDGEIVDVVGCATLECDRDGNPLRSVASLEDVTGKRRAERALAEDRQLLTDLIRESDVATWGWNVQTGEQRLNHRWARLIGTTPAETGLVHALYHPNDRPHSDEKMRLHLAGQSARYLFQGRIQHRSGAYVWVQSQGAVMTRTADGAPEWVIGWASDVTEQRLQAEALRRGARFLEAVGGISGAGAWQYKLATGAGHWSAEIFRIHALEPGEPPSQEQAIGFHPPAARQVLRAAWERAIETGQGWDLELDFVRADGQAAIVRSTGNAIEENGKPVRLAGALQDITTNTIERRARRGDQERLEVAGQTLGIWIWDVASDEMAWDREMCRLYGMQDAPDPSGAYWRWRNHLHPADRAAAEQAVADALAGKRPFDAEFRIVGGDGATRSVRASGRVVRDADGSALRMIGTSRDVTESRRLEAEQQQLRMALRAIGDGVITADAAGRIVWLNQVAERLTGWSASAAAGRSVPEVFHIRTTGGATARTDPVVERLAHGAAAAAASRLAGRDGTEFSVEESVTPMRNESGESLGEVLVFRDVTEQQLLRDAYGRRERELRDANVELGRLARHFAKARNVAEQASRAKTRFLAAMSHELRTPLNGMLGYAQLLRMGGGLTALQSERLEAVLGAGTHLLEMINCVLDLSEIETEGVELQTSAIEVYGLAEACLDTLRPSASARGLGLALTVAPDMPGQVMADPARLRQVVLNLLGNAVKFTASGTVELRFRLAEGGTRLRLEVADSGAGIPPDKRPLLFEAFEELDPGAVGLPVGAGLGLTLAKRLTALMGGQLGHDDNPLGGSVFWLELPLEIPVAPAPPPAWGFDFAGLVAAPVAEEPAPADAASGVRAAAKPVLVVDDVAMNRDIAGAFLRSAGHDVICVEGGAEAIAAAATTDWLVILMDVRMPEIDGLEATRCIRALDGPRGTVPIVALTAQVFTEQIEACRQAGMDAHVAKPFTLDTLLGAIARGVAAGRARGTAQPEERAVAAGAAA